MDVRTEQPCEVDRMTKRLLGLEGEVGGYQYVLGSLHLVESSRTGFVGSLDVRSELLTEALHHKYRARCVADDALADAAGHPALEPGPSVRSHYDHRGRLILCHLRNLLRGGSLADHKPQIDRRPADLLDELLHCRCDAALDFGLIVILREHPGIVKGGMELLFEHMKDD